MKALRMREMVRGGGFRTTLAAAALSGLMMQACPAHVQEPETLDVAAYLRQQPAGLAEILNRPESGCPLGGRIADCRGRRNCSVPVSPGDIFMNLKILPEEGGNVEISVTRVGGDGVLLTKRTDAQFKTSVEKSLSVPFGKTVKLFNTDVKIRMEKGANGTVRAFID